MNYGKACGAGSHIHAIGAPAVQVQSGWENCEKKTVKNYRGMLEDRMFGIIGKSRKTKPIIMSKSTGSEIKSARVKYDNRAECPYCKYLTWFPHKGIMRCAKCREAFKVI